MESSKNYVLNFIVFSVGYILFGLLLLFAPDTSQQIICYVFGCVAIVLGIVRIVQHFVVKDGTRVFRSDIPIGVMLLAAGIYLIVRYQSVWEWLPVLLGFAIIFDSILKLQHAVDLRFSGFKPWWIWLGISLATAVLGLLLILGIFKGSALVMFWGISLIVDGIVNIVTILLVVYRSKKQQKQNQTQQDIPAEEKQPPGE